MATRRGCEEAADERPSDTELVGEMLGGDDEAFEILFRRHRDHVVAVAARYLPAFLTRRVSVADVVQETHWAAYEGRRAFEPRGPNSFRNWVLKIAELKTRQIVRHHAGTAKRDVAREVTGAGRPTGRSLPTEAPSPSQVAIGEEAAECARDVLMGLPPAYREVLQLTRDEHRSLREAAELMGQTYGATRKLMSRALARFTEEYGRRQRGEP